MVPSPITPQPPPPITSTFHQYFSAGLGRNARIASWIVAFAGAGIWMYLEKKDSGKVTQFDTVDAKVWNDECKKNNSKKTKKDNANDTKDCTDPDPKQHKK